ncbi:MAG: imidazolonepropionase [Pseudomonadota bacterium]
MIQKLVRNASLFTPLDGGGPATGPKQGKLMHIPRAAILIENGLITCIGAEKEVLATLKSVEIDEEIDAAGACMIPGFVDPHTHLCFATPREAEFSKRLQGMPYLEILQQGGGILSSVAAIRQTSEEDLFQLTRKRLLKSLSFGSTTLEIKSGYGLDTENELKMLRVINRVGRSTLLDVVPTFLGAHAVPPAYVGREDAYIDLVINEMLPLVKSEKLAGQCDIFCERGVFSLEQSRRLLTAAKDLGFKVKIHADEVNDLGGAGLAAELQALSADHLLAVSDEGIARLAAAGVVATLLPATAYSLKKQYARAKDMLACGVPLALATDCNPGSCFCESMPFVIGLAVLNMGLSPAEALTAATLNAAYAIGMAGKVGSLQIGKQADFLLLDGESPAILAFHAGAAPILSVYKRGEKIN